MFGGKCPFGHQPSDPFKAKREAAPVARYEFQGEQIPMILRHADVRQAAKDWKTYSSDAPFRVPIPSEEAVRTMRQLPIETNPPEHTEYRAIVGGPRQMVAAAPSFTTMPESALSEAVFAVSTGAVPL